MRRALGITLVAGSLIFLAPGALAADPVRADCLAHIPATARLKFNDETHRRWYHRFWAGSCDGLSWFGCSSGRPHMNDAIRQILEAAPPQQRAELLAKGCKVGHLIGYEWAKDNSIRCIHTSDADKFLTIWNTKAEVAARLDRIEARAHAMLRCRTGRAVP